MRNTRLFVYGSLRRDAPGSRHELLGDPAECLGRGRVRGRLLNLGAYPGLVHAVTREDWVLGELYELGDRRALAGLDGYEDYDPHRPERSLFVRREANVVLDSGEIMTAWVYCYAGPMGRGRRIASGDYLDAAAERP
ncbi:gamma-glutamylcyclotransferase family protein [Thioalkalivibrio sp. XN8]|uniref:gamma-glutamylcyclotransferase n=1 Tax=Thioalkalivibrio sp. XN8 TaxID=2712863 RepID=UPI0013EB66DA|nr:gamma-glutamylcyclotransferase [Thioalkalivibrio sp. XN8]